MRPRKHNLIDPLPTAGPAAEGEATLRQPRGKPGVLVADDNYLLRLMVQLLLERSGFATWQASNGWEALDLYWDHRDSIDLVLLDVHMPGLDGPQTLQALRELNPEVLVCFMSGDASAYEPEGLLQRGTAYVIAKPFQPEDLANVLRLMMREGSADLCPADAAYHA